MGRQSKYPDGAGIYKLTCSITNKIYIGKAINIRKRIKNHKCMYRCLNSKGHLQRAIVKYGWDSFTVEILEIVEDFNKFTDNEELLKRESYYIELFDSTNKDIGYNTCKFSTDRTGIPTKHTEEAKEKMRLAALRRTYSEEEKERLRTINIGRTLSDEHREKIRQGNLGKIVSEETRKKLSESSKGKPKSREAVEKTRQSNLGRKASEETKEKMRNSHKKRLEGV